MICVRTGSWDGEPVMGEKQKYKNITIQNSVNMCLRSTKMICVCTGSGDGEPVVGEKQKYETITVQNSVP